MELLQEGSQRTENTETADQSATPAENDHQELWGVEVRCKKTGDLIVRSEPVPVGEDLLEDQFVMDCVEVRKPGKQADSQIVRELCGVLSSKDVELFKQQAEADCLDLPVWVAWVLRNVAKGRMPDTVSVRSVRDVQLPCCVAINSESKVMAAFVDPNAVKAHSQAEAYARAASDLGMHVTIERRTANVSAAMPGASVAEVVGQKGGAA